MCRWVLVSRYPIKFYRGICVYYSSIETCLAISECKNIRDMPIKKPQYQRIDIAVFLNNYYMILVVNL